MKDPTALQTLIPSGSVLVHAESEGDFFAPAWVHLQTGIYGITCGGHLDECNADDEADRITAFVKSLRFVEDAQPRQFLWDLRSLRAIGSTGLKLLKEFHRGVSSRAACALVQNGNLQQPISLVTLLADCYMADSVADAMAWLETRKNGSG
jgi:hypothetical protein